MTVFPFACLIKMVISHTDTIKVSIFLKRSLTSVYN